MANINTISRASALNYSENLVLQLEKNSRERTARAYRSAVRRLVAFNDGNDIPLNEINADLIKSFEIFLKDEGVAPNTISFYMRNLRAIYYKAVADKHIEPLPENPFSEVKKGMEDTIKSALSVTDIQKLLDFDFSLCKDTEQTERFRTAQQLFLFSFYTRGMCFVDIAYLRKKDIQNNIIRYYRRKTGRLTEIRVTAEIREIIESFSDEVSDSDYLFPIIKTEDQKKARLQYETALRKQNRCLEQMSQMAGMNKITMHVARHSWANICKENNLPLSVISECLGHSSEKITEIYLSNINNTVLDDANDVVIGAIRHIKQD